MCDPTATPRRPTALIWEKWILRMEESDRTIARPGTCRAELHQADVARDVDEDYSKSHRPTAQTTADGRRGAKSLGPGARTGRRHGGDWGCPPTSIQARIGRGRQKLDERSWLALVRRHAVGDAREAYKVSRDRFSKPKVQGIGRRKVGERMRRGNVNNSRHGHGRPAVTSLSRHSDGHAGLADGIKA